MGTTSGWAGDAPGKSFRTPDHPGEFGDRVPDRRRRHDRVRGERRGPAGRAGPRPRHLPRRVPVRRAAARRGRSPRRRDRPAGCGESSAKWPSYSRTDIAGDLLALVRHLGGPAVLVGHSISGGAATIAAAGAPGAISGIVELAPFTRALIVEGSLDPDWVDPRAQGEALVAALPGLGWRRTTTRAGSADPALVASHCGSGNDDVQGLAPGRRAQLRVAPVVRLPVGSDTDAVDTDGGAWREGVLEAPPERATGIRPGQGLVRRPDVGEARRARGPAVDVHGSRAVRVVHPAGQLGPRCAVDVALHEADALVERNPRAVGAARCAAGPE
ncbi:MAG: Putative hydrolase [uncultured Pseudonocardia sp.]|uniref:Hydrolase n=1 Tax=uncultured Pseudonocardia sp. TaxID=211455 RepID=A0A6J4QDH6_9PSEU|nr:MAG: Putative hydrolase [uncultured Pseudonocardia sp.]